MSVVTNARYIWIVTCPSPPIFRWSRSDRSQEVAVWYNTMESVFGGDRTFRKAGVRLRTHTAGMESSASLGSDRRMSRTMIIHRRRWWWRVCDVVVFVVHTRL
jgi:hypothetical protein